MPIIPTRCVEDMFVYDKVIAAGNFNIQIDKAIYVGADSYKCEVDRRYISTAKSGGIDYISTGINYAKSKGIKFYLLFPFLPYTTGTGHGESFRTNIDAQNAYINDFEWLLNRYPNIDGLELEEPHFGGTTSTDPIIIAQTIQRNQDFWSPMFDRLKVIKDKYHSDISNFAYGFNCASNETVNVAMVGIDTNYINSNKLFNFYMIQNLTINSTSLNTFINQINTWKQRLPNLNIITISFVSATDYLNQPSCANTWANSTCYNQLTFDEIEWTRNNNVPISIFTLGYLDQTLYYWQAAALKYPHPTGNYGKDIVKALWEVPQICPTPQYNYIIT